MNDSSSKNISACVSYKTFSILPVTLKEIAKFYYNNLTSSRPSNNFLNVYKLQLPY